MSNPYRTFAIVMLTAGLAATLAACGNADISLSEQPPVENAKGNIARGNTAEGDSVDETEVNEMGFDFSVSNNVEITGMDLSELSAEEEAVLHQQARYCQAMTEADTETMREIASPDMVFTHMSGRQQTREEYFADIAAGNLRYFTVGIENPVVSINGSYASVSYTSVLNADAYGARGTYRIDGTHWFEKRDENWIACNAPGQ